MFCPPLRTNYPLKTNRFKKRQEKRRHQDAITIVASDARLRSVLGLMLRRLFLYSGNLPAYQAASLIQQGRPLYTEREGFTQYYR
jgi:hypothetical protein